MHPYESVNKSFEKSFRKFWERPALTNYQGATLCYKDLARRIARLHLFFEEAGIQKGDRIAICSRNQSGWVVAFFSTLTYGAVPVPLLHEFKPVNIHHLVGHSQARLLFADDGIWKSLDITQMPSLMAVVKVGKEELYYATDNLKDIWRRLDLLFERKYPDGFVPDSLSYHTDSPDELALINYTSGTSGFSKGVMLPYRSLRSNLQLAYVAEPQMNEHSKVVSMLPSAHMYGLMFEIFFEMSIGAEVIFLTRLPSPKIILNAMAQVRPDIVIAVPLVIEKIYKSQIKPRIEKPFIRLMLALPLLNRIVTGRIRKQLVDAFGGRFREVIIGGAAFNKDIEKFFRLIRFPFTVGYGMTECGPIVTYAPWNRAKLYSCGKAAPNMEIRINSPRPDKVPGEVMLKGDNVFLGYYNNPDATQECFSREGWFRTGDMGVMDGDGYLFLRGRSKCMILSSNGQNIYPEEIESVLNNLPYVIDTLVIEDEGSLVALVYPDFKLAQDNHLSDNALKVTIEESIQKCNADFPNYSRISSVEILPDDFERTPKKSIKRYLYQR